MVPVLIVSDIIVSAAFFSGAQDRRAHSLE